MGQRVTERQRVRSFARSTPRALRALLVVALLGVAVWIPAVPGSTLVQAAARPPRPATSHGTAKPMPKTPPQPKGLPPLQNGFGPTPAQKAAMATASRSARASGKAVPVDDLTSETQQIVAVPKGGFSVASNPQPVRASRHGAWVPVDTTLHRNEDGTFSPAATGYGDVVLSGSGTAALASTTSGSTTYSITWPSPLPAPAVSGSTATYANVLPGVDLVVSATTAGGFSDVLVVKDAASARNPALSRLSLSARVAGGRIAPAPHGGVTITGAPGAPALEAATPIMWDSTTRQASRNASRQAVGSDRSDAAHPGQAARVSTVQAHAGPATLDLVPDRRLLADKATVFPVYIDPTFNWHPTTGGTPAFDEVKQGAPCTNTSFFDNAGLSGEFGNLGVGVNGWDSCFGTMRAYYQWQVPSVVWGSHIGLATVNATKTYSASCGTTATVNLHWAGGIGQGTSWNTQPGYTGSIAQADYGPAANPTFCPNNPQVTHGFDVTGVIGQIAAARGGQFTVALTEDAYEASRNDLGFSRFADNPTLQLLYNLAPYTPGPGQLEALSGSDNVGCATNPPYPYMGKTLATNTPVLGVWVADPDGDQLQATFQYWVEGGAPAASGTSADNQASSSVAAFSLPPSFTGSLTNGQVVDWQARISDGMDWSGWSPVCHFIAEVVAPSAPAISSADGRNPSNGTVGALAGTPSQFTIAATSGGVNRLVQNIDLPPPTNSPPANEIAPFSGGGVVAPTARWRLADGTGTTGADAAGNHPASLFGGASWTNDPTRGSVLTFDGSSGYAQTVSGPIVDTGGSYTVSTWVNVPQTPNLQTFVVQQGNVAGGLYLEYDSTTNRWAFSRVASDTTNGTPIRAESGAAPQFNTWTHLAGVYDFSSATMTLYVNGVASGSAIDNSPFTAGGPLAVGRGWYNGAFGNWTKGSISDVQTYQAALSPSQIARLYAGGVAAPAGRWRFLEGSGAMGADSSGGGHPVALSGGHGWAAQPVGAATFDGATGAAATSGPVLDTTRSFSVSAWVNLPQTPNLQTFVVQQGNVAGGLYLEYDGPANRWAFSRVASDTTNGTPIRAESGGAPQFNTWTHLVGVYDAPTGAMTLYVDGAAAGTATDTTPFASTGPLVIGRGWYNGSAGNYAGASITDVQVYQSALDAAEVGQMHSSSTIGLTPPAPGPHTLYSYAADNSGNASAYQAYPFIAAADPATSCASLAACFNNTAISPDSNPALASGDGYSSMSANDLAAAGWTSGGQVTIDGATFTLPAFGAGQADNVMAANQTVAFNRSIPATGATALSFLTTATSVNTASPGAVLGNTTSPYVPAGTAVAGTYCFDSTNPAAFCAPSGTINFSDGTSQTYDLTVPDWVLGPASLAAVVLPHWNRPSGQLSTYNPRLYAFSVPLPPGKTVVSVTLPDVGGPATLANAGLHIFSMATRNPTIDQAPAGQTWTGAWASPTEGNFGFAATANGAGNQTFRFALKPSVSGGTVRVKLDDALGTSPLTIAHATVALSTAPPVPSGPVASMTFGGSQAVTIPEGGMVFSDPLPFAVTANQWVLVSFHLANVVRPLVEHSWASNAIEYLSATGSGDQTADTTGSPFSGWSCYCTNLLTDLDVATAGLPTQALLGDGLVVTPKRGGTAPSPRLAEDIAAAAPTTPGPLGTISEGIQSDTLMADTNAPAALSRVDRDILDQPGLTTVVVNQGMQDVLGGRAFADITGNGYTQLFSFLAAYGISMVVVGQSPCDGWNSLSTCTPTIDAERTQVNRWLSGYPVGLNPWSTPGYFFLDADPVLGVPDTTNGETKLSAVADAGDHLNLSASGYAELASAYLGPQDTWRLDDGAGTTAGDSASGASDPSLIHNPEVGANPATLTGGSAWTTDSARGNVLQLDGTSGAATTAGTVVDTTRSFSVSAWVNLSSTAHDADVLTEDGSQSSAFLLKYSAASGGWWFQLCGADGASSQGCTGVGGSATVGAWTHLTGTYDATTGNLTLYVNGALSVGGQTSHGFAASGPLAIGRGKSSGASADFFSGRIADVQVWNYALSSAQDAALYQQTR